MNRNVNHLLTGDRYEETEPSQALMRID